MPSFDLALKHGCDGFEFDVRLSGSGNPVICHDDEVAGVRVTDPNFDDLSAVPHLTDVFSAACPARLSRYRIEGHGPRLRVADCFEEQSSAAWLRSFVVLAGSLDRFKDAGRPYSARVYLRPQERPRTVAGSAHPIRDTALQPGEFETDRASTYQREDAGYMDRQRQDFNAAPGRMGSGRDYLRRNRADGENLRKNEIGGLLRGFRANVGGGQWAFSEMHSALLQNLPTLAPLAARPTQLRCQCDSLLRDPTPPTSSRLAPPARAVARRPPA